MSLLLGECPANLAGFGEHFYVLSAGLMSSRSLALADAACGCGRKHVAFCLWDQDLWETGHKNLLLIFIRSSVSERLPMQQSFLRIYYLKIKEWAALRGFCFEVFCPNKTYPFNWCKEIPSFTNPKHWKKSQTLNCHIIRSQTILCGWRHPGYMWHKSFQQELLQHLLPMRGAAFHPQSCFFSTFQEHELR